MVIAIEYKNGRMKEFDTSAFTTTNARVQVIRQLET